MLRMNSGTKSFDPSRRNRKSKLTRAKLGLQCIQGALGASPVPSLVTNCVPIVVSIITALDGVKSNEDACLRLAEKATEIVSAIINQTGGRRDTMPETLTRALCRLEITLMGILNFLNFQKQSYLKRFLNYGGDADVIMTLNLDLDDALAVFELKAQIAIHRKLEVLHILIEGEQKMILTPARESEANREDLAAHLLPPLPTAFYGREPQLQMVVNAVLTEDVEKSHCCILGAGGIGKTTLATRTLYDDSVVATFGGRRYFVPCDAANSAEGLISVIASHLGLSGDKLLQQIMQFLNCPNQRSIIVLDNFESPWLEAPTGVEEILNRLTSVKTITVLITLRGTERPLGTSWSRPFLKPLEPLDIVSARQLFSSISDHTETDHSVEELLKVLDNLPLAIKLMANLAQYESPYNLLERWKSEHTEMVTRGGNTSDRLSSLDISIGVSLTGPVMRNEPTAEALLRLIALLPDGVQNNQHLTNIASQIPNVVGVGAVLRRVSLAYSDGSRVLRVLAPIRSYVQFKLHSDPIHLKTMLVYYQSLASTAATIEGGSNVKEIVENLTPEVGNIQAVLERAFIAVEERDEVSVYIQAAIDCTDLFKYTGLGSLRHLVEARGVALRHNLTRLAADCIKSEAELNYSRSNRLLAIQLFKDALVLYTGLKFLPGQGRCKLMLGMAESQSGNYADAIAKIKPAQDLFRLGQDELGEADCFLRLAQNATWRREFESSTEFVEKALGIYRVHGHSRGQARCMWLIGVISYEQHIEYEAASRILEDAATLYSHLGDAAGEANCFRILGRILFAHGNYGLGIHHLEESIKIYVKVKWVFGEADCYQALGELAMAQGRDMDAKSALQKAQQLYQDLDHNEGQVFCICRVGDIAFRTGDFIDAELLYNQALEMSKSDLDQGRARLGKAKVLLALWNVGHAEKVLIALQELFSHEVRAMEELGITFELMGDAALQKGSKGDALKYYDQAIDKFQQVNLTPEVAKVQVKLASISDIPYIHSS